MDFLSEDIRRDPYPLYEQLRATAPACQLPGTEIWLLLGYEDVRRALQDHDAFSSRAAPPGGKPLDWLIFHDPPRHTQLRALIQRAFTPRVIAGLEGRIRELSRELLDQVIERGEMDLAADFAVPLPLLVIAEMLGIPLADRPRFRRWSEATMDLAETVGGGEAAARAAQAFAAAKAEMAAYLADQLAARRAAGAPGEDLLSRLAAAEVDGVRLREDEILGFFQLLLAAGSETTTNLINNAILCLAEAPGERARLLAAPRLLPQAIEEVLRYRSPVQAMFRETRREVEVAGRRIPAGRLVLVGIGAANRDPRHFPEAARFDITREPNPHLAFGQGAHFCLGAPLARLEARIALADLLARLPDFSLAGAGPWTPRRAFHVHGPSRLPIRFTPGPRAAA